MIAPLLMVLASLNVPTLHAAPPLRARLGGAWNDGATFHLTHEATYRTKASDDTTVHIGLYHDTLYVAFQAQQREPCIATQLTDGPGVLTGDAVMIHLWPDGLSGYAYWFATNLHGARDQYSSENSAFAPAWTAFGQRTAGGYVAILEIPLRVLHVSSHGHWRAQFHRIVTASNSNDVWELDPGQASFIDGRYGGRLFGLDHANHRSVRPRLQIYGLGAFASPRAGGFTSRTGADFSLPIGPTASIFGTVHPDFSDVEIDQQSIAPTEFARRFSEVRPFFTQAAANFNQAQDMSSPESTLYTPAIPAFRDGFGLSGREGTVSFGAFDAAGNQRDDNAFAFNASDKRQRLALNLQRVRVTDSRYAFDDTVDSTGLSFVNPSGHLLFFANDAREAGTSVTKPSDASYDDVGAMYSTATSMLGVTIQRMGPQFNPADGYADQPPGAPGIAGYTLYGSRQFNYSPGSRVLDLFASLAGDRYRGPNGAVNQSDISAQLRADLKNLMSVGISQTGTSLATCVPDGGGCGLEMLPYDSTGISLGYALSTSHPSSISYNSGRYYHGTLTSWLRSVSLPLTHRAALLLEADDTRYTSSVGQEPNSRQWLERASVNYQFDRALSLDVGTRKIIGTNQPFAFSPAVAYTDATNLSAALHFFKGDNEFFIVYGDPNQLVTSAALYVKFIRYLGAGKGS